MGSVTVRGLDDDVRERLRIRAARNTRGSLVTTERTVTISTSRHGALT